MKQLAISLCVGFCAALAVAAALAAVVYLRLPVTQTELAGVAALFAFAGTVSMLSYAHMGRPKPKQKPNQILAMAISELEKPEFEYLTRFPPRKKSDDTASFIIDHQTDVEVLKYQKNLEAVPNIMLTFRKGTDKSMFNPLKVNAIFAALKGMPGFQHVLLADERDEYIGYIPGYWARTNLGGKGDEAKIVKYILDVLANPETNVILRDIHGLATTDQIGDGETVGTALNRLGGGIVRGLVVMHGLRHKKPVGILYWNDLYKIATLTA
jgi:hypothetical protein